MPEPTSPPEPINTPKEDVSEPTLAMCQAWIQANHSLDYSNHGCEEHAAILNSVEGIGGGVIPLGDNRFFIAWFPDDWGQLSNRKLIVTLHGNGGCAERLFQWWAGPASERNYAVVALQYAEENATGELVFDDSSRIYEYLHVVLGELQANCPLDDTSAVYHGFSRGSALSFQMALMDRAPDGMHTFDAFISDSGGGFAESGGEIPDYLQNAPENAYQDAHFWLYCGEQDHNGRTCQDMDRMVKIIPTLGGTVDELYKYPPGGHGIFITAQPDGPGPALTALFDYIDAIGNR